MLPPAYLLDTRRARFKLIPTEQLKLFPRMKKQYPLLKRTYEGVRWAELVAQPHRNPKVGFLNLGMADVIFQLELA
jgi:hypothetical protein